MADVEMTDAPPKTKVSKAGPSGDFDSKKRFEVKKVTTTATTLLHTYA